MKWIRYTIFLFVGICWFCGCQKDDLSGFEDSEKLAITLSGGIEQEMVSRVNDDGFCDEDVMGVYIVDYEGENPGELQLDGIRASNVRFTYDEAANRWNGAYDIYWKDKNTPIDIYGYYPYAHPESIDAYAFEVQKDQSREAENGRMGGYEASDFLWAKAEKVAPTERVIRLAFRHRMSAVRVRLMEGDGFAENEWQEVKKQVLVMNTRWGASIDLNTGAVAARGEISSSGIIPFERAGEFWAIVVPQTVEAGLELFRLTVDGTVYSFRKDEAFIYTGSKMHNFTIQVNKKEATGEYEFSIVGESITAWENDPVSHNATAKEYLIVESRAGELTGCLFAASDNPAAIKNLKIIGEISGHDFYFLADSMPSLEALNLKEVRIVANPGGGVDRGGREYEEDKIPTNALMANASLRYLELPFLLKKIGQNAFADCAKLTGSLVIPEGVIEIDECAFSGCISLNGRLSLPSTLVYIRRGAFQNTSFISELRLPDKLRYIGDFAFAYDKYLYGDLVLPDALTYLGTYAFHNCEQLSGDIRIPQGITEIGICTFRSCNFNGQLILHDGITLIGADAFAYNHLKGELKLPRNLTEISDFSFYGNSFSGVLELPKNIEIIGNYAFGYNHNLSGKLIVPDRVRTVGACAFAWTNLQEVVLPEKLEYIFSGKDGIDGAFWGCSNLTRVVCEGAIPPKVQEGSFNDVPKEQVVIEVPESAVEQYRITAGWNEFPRITAHRELECQPLDIRTLQKGDSRSLIIRAEGEWEVKNIPSWCSLSKMNGNGKEEIQLTVAATGEVEDRVGEIVFGLKGTDYTATCQVHQYVYEYNEDEMIVLQEHSVGRGVKVVFLGDGFDAEGIASGKYMQIMQAQMEAFFELEPYRSYRNYFDVYTRVAVSLEKGICTENTLVQNKFGTRYVSDAGLKCDVDLLFNYVSEIPAIGKDNLNRTLIVLAPNTADYQGHTELWEDGSAIAFCPLANLENAEILKSAVQHEAGGHAFGKLADEDYYHNSFIEYCSCSCCPHVNEIRHLQGLGWYANVSLTGKMHEVPWAHMLQDSRYYTFVDIYEGALGHLRGVYRSEPNSCMSDSSPYFNAISREAIVKRIMEYAGETYSFEKFAEKDRQQTSRVSRSTQRGSGTIGQHVPPRVHKGKPRI